MVKKIILLVVLLVVSGIGFGESGIVTIKNFSMSPQGNIPEYAADQLIVKYRRSDSLIDTDPEMAFRVSQKNIRRISKIPLEGYYVIYTVPGTDLAELKVQLTTNPLVEDISYNYYARISETIPNDPYLRSQYSLNNTGQLIGETPGYNGTIGSDVKALDAWDWTTGSQNTVIAILDTGVAHDHEDLEDKVNSGYNFIDLNDDPYDDNGHGTLVASIAAANTNNDLGIAGVSWASKIMPVKVLDRNGIGDYLAISLGIIYAADNGANVINLSLGGTADIAVLEDACAYAYNKGCVIIASSGNHSAPVEYPAAYDDYCLAVGASDASDDLATFSNFGDEIDVVAPGVDIIGAYFSPADPAELSSYSWASGTSYAAPIVAGAAALLKSYKPFLSNTAIMDLIRYTSDDTNYSDYPGVDEYMGYGRLNLDTLIGPYVLD